MEKNYAKKQKGITLIALVVTIVILLILSGISLNIVLSNNGIITKAQEAKTLNSHSTVLESLQIENSSYETEYELGDTEVDFETYLKNKGIIDGNFNVNTAKLVGKKTSAGNGKNHQDVYTIEVDDVEDGYRLKYYGKNESENKDLGIIGYKKGEADEPSDPSIFNFNPRTGEIALKGAMTGYGISKDEEINENVTHLKKIVVPEEIDGVKVTKIGNRGQNYYEHIGFTSSYVEKIVLPNTITEIGDDAFASCINLKKINIPDSVASIGSHAFWNCRSLESINIPDCCTWINEMTFFNCKSLKSISLPSHLLGIDRSSFEGCGVEKIIIPGSVSKIAYDVFRESKLKYVEIENGVKGIGTAAFYDCEDLIEVSIPESVTSIEYDSFDECKMLQAINVSENNTAYTSENGVLMNKKKTTIKVYPSGKKESTFTIGKNINYVDADLFNYCSNLQSFDVEEGNTNYSAEGGVLFNKDKTKIVRYPIGKTESVYNVSSGVTKIDEYAFYNCNNLIEVSIPKSVTSVYYNSFYECKKLQAINVNDDNTAYTSENGVLMNKNKTSINVYPSGKKESTYTIGKSISYVNAYLFKYCSNLQAFNVEEENANYSAEDGVLFNKDKTRIERYPVGKTDAYIINSSITDIGHNAFEGCNNVHITVAAGSRLNASSFLNSGLSDSQIANITFEN